MSVDPKKAALQIALGSKDKVQIERALVEYLKDGSYNPSVSSVLQDNIAEICDLDTTRKGVSADKCISLLTSCIVGNKTQCITTLSSLTEDIEKNGLVFGPNFKNTKAITDILVKLGIDTAKTNPIEYFKNWMTNFLSTTTITEDQKTILRKILGSTPIMKLLSTLVIRVKKPELIPSTPGHNAELDRLMGTVAPLPPRGGPSRSRPNDYGAIPPRNRTDGSKSISNFSTFISNRNDISKQNPNYLFKNPRIDSTKLVKDYLNPTRYSVHGDKKITPSTSSSVPTLPFTTFVGAPASALLSSSTLLPSSGTPRIGGGNMIGGGSMFDSFNNKRNVSMVRYLDSIERNYKMIGGDGSGIILSPHLRQTYTDFLEELQIKGKRIESADAKVITDMLDSLENSEKKLNKVAAYITRYNELKDDVRFTNLLNVNPITIDILHELEKQYQELSSKVSSKGLAAKSALEQIHKVLASTSSSDFTAYSDNFLQNF
jgi:hypothetical protein